MSPEKSTLSELATAPSPGSSSSRGARLGARQVCDVCDRAMGLWGAPVRAEWGTWLCMSPPVCGTGSL